jgi:hypothetical protein
MPSSASARATCVKNFVENSAADGPSSTGSVMSRKIASYSPGCALASVVWMSSTRSSTRGSSRLPALHDGRCSLHSATTSGSRSTLTIRSTLAWRRISRRLAPSPVPPTSTRRGAPCNTSAGWISGSWYSASSASADCTRPSRNSVRP